MILEGYRPNFTQNLQDERFLTIREKYKTEGGIMYHLHMEDWYKEKKAQNC